MTSCDIYCRLMKLKAHSTMKVALLVKEKYRLVSLILSMMLVASIMTWCKMNCLYGSLKELNRFRIALYMCIYLINLNLL